MYNNHKQIFPIMKIEHEKWKGTSWGNDRETRERKMRDLLIKCKRLKSAISFVLGLHLNPNTSE